MQKKIEEASRIICEAIMDGQNQVHDLRDGKATPEDIAERMRKSSRFHLDRMRKLLN